MATSSRTPGDDGGKATSGRRTGARKRAANGASTPAPRATRSRSKSVGPAEATEGAASGATADAAENGPTGSPGITPSGLPTTAGSRPSDPLDRLTRLNEKVAAANQPEVTGSNGRGRGARPEFRNRREAFRYRVLPRSVLGVTSLILAFAIGAGFSGVVLYSYYQYKLNQTNTKVNNLVTGYKTAFSNAEGDLNNYVNSAKASIADQLKAVQQTQTSPSVLAALIKQMAPSVFFVHTLDSSGQASVGTAFVVASSSTQSLLLTSYTTVDAATKSPGPPVYIEQGTNQTQVTVRTWDPTYDLALLVLPTGNLPVISAAPTSPAAQPGDHLFAVSGLGTAGASITQATVVDVSSSGLALDAAMGTAFQGGPIINQAGQVVSVGSRTYSPLGFTTTGIWYAPYVEAACNKVLTCPGGSLVGSH